MKVKSESEVSQSCLTLSDPMDCSLPGSSVHGIFQGRVLEWGAIAFSKKMRQVYAIHNIHILHYLKRKNIDKVENVIIMETYHHANINQKTQ